jgi:hypothetical protein
MSGMGRREFITLLGGSRGDRAGFCRALAFASSFHDSCAVEPAHPPARLSVSGQTAGRSDHLEEPAERF